MAVQNSTVALSAADTAAHRAASHVRPDRAEVRTRICQETVLELSAMDARDLTPADYRRLANAQAELDQLNARRTK